MVQIPHGFDAAHCISAATEIEADLTRLTAALSEAQFHAPSRAGGWSVGYCIEHLILAGNAFLARWDAAMQAAESRRPHTSFEYGWLERRLLSWIADPSRMMCKSPPSLVPFARHSIDETVKRFHVMHQQFALRIEASRTVDAKRTLKRYPVLPWIRYSLGFSFDLALAHEMRHLRQARATANQVANDLANDR
jgi:hypothetical protein